MNIHQEVTKKPRRKSARSAWHEQAREMRRNGSLLREIAEKLGKKIPAISVVTKDILDFDRKAPRPEYQVFRGPSTGFQMGVFKRIAVNFPPEQISEINRIAEANNWSFSKSVTQIVARSLRDETPSEFERMCSK